MTAKELIKILEVLPDEQHICFSLKRLQESKKTIECNLSLNNKSAILVMEGYERCYIGDEEDELFIINLHMID